MAIARDATSHGFTNSGASLTISHTCSGSNRLLAYQGMLLNARSYTSITYAGVGATGLSVVRSTGNDQEVIGSYLIAPSTGTNDIVYTPDSTTFIYVGAESLTGAKQSAQPDSTGSATTTTGTITATATVVAENCWGYLGVRNLSDGNSSAGTGSTLATNDSGVLQTYDTNGVVASGSRSMSATGTTGGMDAALMFFAPSTSTTTTLTLSDSLVNAIIENISRIWTAPRSRTDMIGFQSEGVTRTWSLSRGLPIDILTISELVTGIKSRMLLILENLGIVESVGRTVSWVRSPSESVGITESVMRYFLRTISLTETVLVTETIAFMKIFNRTYSDVVSIIEHVRFPLNWLKRVVPTSVWTPRTPPSSTDWHPRVKP